MNEDGTITIPAELCARQRWAPGTVLLLVETNYGILLTSREQAKQQLGKELQGASLADELSSERRAAAELDATD